MASVVIIELVQFTAICNGSGVLLDNLFLFPMWNKSRTACSFYIEWGDETLPIIHNDRNIIPFYT